MKIKLLFILLFLPAGLLLAQFPYIARIQFSEPISSLEKKWQPRLVADSLAEANFSKQLLLDCYAKGYFLCELIPQQKIGDTVLVWVQTGKPYGVKNISQGNVPSEWLGSSDIFRQNKGKQISSLVLWKEMEQILVQAENQGYPFASLRLDSILADSDGITASLHMDKNRLVLFDTLDYGGTAKISKQFLRHYSGIQPGMPYQEKLISKLDARLSELSYVQVVRPLGIYFYGNKAKPYVYINEKKASSFDGVLGVAPNSQVNQKLLLTGDLNLKLVNLLGSGKNLELSYKGYLNNTQDLQIRFLFA